MYFLRGLEKGVGLDGTTLRDRPEQFVHQNLGRVRTKLSELKK